MKQSVSRSAPPRQKRAAKPARPAKRPSPSTLADLPPDVRGEFAALAAKVRRTDENALANIERAAAVGSSLKRLGKKVGGVMRARELLGEALGRSGRTLSYYIRLAESIDAIRAAATWMQQHGHDIPPKLLTLTTAHLLPSHAAALADPEVAAREAEQQQERQRRHIERLREPRRALAVMLCRARRLEAALHDGGLPIPQETLDESHAVVLADKALAELPSAEAVPEPTAPATSQAGSDTGAKVGKRGAAVLHSPAAPASATSQAARKPGASLPAQRAVALSRQALVSVASEMVIGPKPRSARPPRSPAPVQPITLVAASSLRREVAR